MTKLAGRHLGIGITSRLLACLGALAALAGCGDSGVQGGEKVTVYVSMPLRGPAGANGRDVVRGARLALEDERGKVGQLGVRAVYMDDTTGSGPAARWDPVQVAENARRATEDSTAIAYIGELDSGATRASLPITNGAGMLQVSPASGATDLVSELPGTTRLPEEVQTTGERTFGRVIPDDLTQAAAGAAWAKRLGARRAATFSGRSEFGETMVEEFAARAQRLGLSVQGLRRPKAVASLLYVGASADELAGSQALLGAVGAAPRVIATDALLTRDALALFEPLGAELQITSAAQDPSQLQSEAGRRFVRDLGRHGEEPGRDAAYGYEAMAVVLDSIRRAAELGDDRGAVIDAFFQTRNRDSVLGTYSIDPLGNTTLDRLAGYRLRGGQLRFERALATP